MSNPFIGEIRMFGGNYAPLGWAFCSGQTLPISGNEALFNLIGTTYGGDGQSTFALPDLRGRIPIHMGTGAGLSTRVIGEAGGSEAVTLSGGQSAAHSHQFVATNSAASATSPANAFLASPTNIDLYRPGTAPDPAQALAPNTLGPAGGSQPHENTQPFLCVSFIIALVGVYPSQN